MGAKPCLCLSVSLGGASLRTSTHQQRSRSEVVFAVASVERVQTLREASQYRQGLTRSQLRKSTYRKDRGVRLLASRSCSGLTRRCCSGKGAETVTGGGGGDTVAQHAADGSGSDPNASCSAPCRPTPTIYPQRRLLSTTKASQQYRARSVRWTLATPLRKADRRGQSSSVMPMVFLCRLQKATSSLSRLLSPSLGAVVLLRKLRSPTPKSSTLRSSRSS